MYFPRSAAGSGASAPARYEAPAGGSERILVVEDEDAVRAIVGDRLRGLADEVERSWPGTRVVFMSGYSENVLSNDGRLDSGVLMLAKPHQRADLAQIVRSALSGGGRPGLGNEALRG